MSYPPQQGPYGPRQGYGYGYPGYPPNLPPPRGRNTGLIVGVVIGAMLLLGGGALTLVLMLSSDSEDAPAGDPRQVAGSYVTAVNERNAKAIVDVSCSLRDSDGEFAVRQLTEQRVEAVLSDEPAMDSTGNDVAYWVDVTRGNPSGEEPERRYRLLILADGDRWCAMLGAGGMPS